MKIIIGASGGIGSKLFYHYRTIEEESAIGTFNSNGEESEYMYEVDVSAPTSVRAFADSVDLHDGNICLINCSGINYDGMSHKLAIELWGHVIDVNLIGAFHIIQAFLPFMRKREYGRIINMGSMVAQTGISGTSAYAASKAGLWGMSKAIAHENKNKNITINTLNLGYMDAGMGQGFGDTGDVFNIINAIDFLVDSPFVTGTSIDINGGLV